MPIDVTIVKSPDNVNNANPGHTFTEDGGTIGRGANNTWALEDPDKYMSSTHARIDYENGQYTLTDLSTNGTFINGSMEPLGNGNVIELNEGDRFSISDYEFAIDIRAAGDNYDGLLSQPMDQGPFPGMSGSESGSLEAQPFSLNDPFASPANEYVPLSDATSDLDQMETDPLAVLDKASANHHTPAREDQFFSNSFADNGDVINDSIDWPAANIDNGIIPDNWDDDDLSGQPSDNSNHAAAASITANNSDALSKLQNKYLALENKNKQLVAELAMLKSTIKQQKMENSSGHRQSTRTVTLQDKTLIDSMGLSRWHLDDNKIVHINEIAGQLVRETMEGMMQALSFRKKIKEEFRINVTTIQPVENNPLKFSANIDDAMENMFIKENNAYKEPVEALREGFQGISEHQVAVLAGMQAAFRGMLERLDPETLEKQFEKYKKTGVIQLGKKRKHWESYKEYHAELTANLDNSFQHLFGYDFVQAYEEQMQRLVAARKQNK